eukprot:CAMPEP_0194347636 /NCGR_PEP_ID=MMETSP0171-20130528/106099_1 /TAXON_ID=218684 /ORGANISM="Corethron pennatum, Strain L29A3" /LENGTH=93 /DNA_ID=CAMNT_0039114915 /DNA_START=1214 /DNA_END=1496 /DNA_ORIENTATION=-
MRRSPSACATAGTLHHSATASRRPPGQPPHLLPPEKVMAAAAAVVHLPAQEEHFAVCWILVLPWSRAASRRSVCQAIDYVRPDVERNAVYGSG